MHSGKAEDASLRVNKEGLYQAIIFSRKDLTDDVECNINCEIKKSLFEGYARAREDFKNAKPDSSKETIQNFKLAEQQILSYIMKRIKKELAREDILFHFQLDADGHVQMNTFKTELKEASKAYMWFPSPHGDKILLIIGDAFRVPYYPLEGLNDALLQAKNLRLIFNAKNLAEVLITFNSLSKSMASEASRFTFVGTLFGGLVWNKTTKLVKENFLYHQHQVRFPLIHKLMNKKEFKQAKEIFDANPDILFTVNTERKNILHVLNDVEAFEWFFKNYNKAFYQLLTQYNGLNISALYWLVENFPQKLPVIFPHKESLMNFKDYQGNTVAHTIMNLSDVDTLKKALHWLVEISPGLLLAQNDKKEDAIDTLGKAYLKSCYVESSVQQYQQVLEYIVKLFPHDDSIQTRVDKTQAKVNERVMSIRNT